MRVQSTAETTAVEDGVWQLAFDLAGSEPGYLLISKPEDAEAAAGFFGHDHYVEVKDQLFGRYGGVATLRVAGECELEIGLSYEVPGVGKKLSVTTSAPMPTAILSRLRELRCR